jgi:hypothetical protein
VSRASAPAANASSGRRPNPAARTDSQASRATLAKLAAKMLILSTISAAPLPSAKTTAANGG